MSQKPFKSSPSIRFSLVAPVGIALAVLAGVAISAQDKYALQVPDGIAFSEFKGYEDWKLISVSHPVVGDGPDGGEVLNAILGNSIVIEAFESGNPGNGKPFPDGSKMAKIQYAPKKSEDAPFDARIPDTLKDVAFMVKDSEKFAGTGGWGYALFDYDTATDEWAPNGTGASCGAACHTIAKSKDFVFTRYEKR